MASPVKQAIKSLSELNRIEILWILTHPFKAWKTWKISNLARQIANEHISDPDLDGDYAGGQVDAFRHLLWMALITQKYGEKFARKLGRTHEKANKLDFKNNKLEDYQLPDAASMLMDLMNNEIGIQIGKRFPNISLQSLINEVKKYVLAGKAWKIKKDENGNFLDINNNIIPKRLWLRKWNTPKILVPSNFIINHKKSKPNNVTSSNSF